MKYNIICVTYLCCLATRAVVCDFTYERIKDNGESAVQSTLLYCHFNMICNFNIKNVTLVDMNYSLDVFNYCDLNSYTPAGVSRLLEAHHVTQQDIRNGARWVSLVVNGGPMTSKCREKYSMSFYDLYVLNSPILLLYYIQRTGR